MSHKPRAFVSVTNDLLTDQRVHRTCLTLIDKGFEPLLIGRQKRGSLPLPLRPYPALRMKLLFEKGMLFYAEYNLRLFLILLFKKTGLLFANDLDTLLPNYLVSKIKASPLIYDSHEYFTGVPELQNHPVKRKIWSLLERLIIPRLKMMITVNGSIAGLYHSAYGNDVKVVRNLPLSDPNPQPAPGTGRKQLGLPENADIVLLQGAGINVDRGAEEAVQAMQWVNSALLLIIGGGDAIPGLKKLVNRHQLGEKVMFINKLPFEQLRQYTIAATIGITLDKDTNLNYRYSLPNKLFDYIHAGVPVLASALPEVKKIIDAYQIGECTDSVTPEAIAAKLNGMLRDKERLNWYKGNTLKAKTELCWENEKGLLGELILKAAHQTEA